jgi:hypothetical protein
MANEKELKISAKIISDGFEKAARDNAALRKELEGVNRGFSDMKRALDAVVSGQKAAASSIRETNTALKQQNDLTSVAKSAGERYRQMGAGQFQYPTSQSGFSDYKGTDIDPSWKYKAPGSGINWGRVGKGMQIGGSILGGVGAAVGLGASLYDSYYARQERKAEQAITEKSIGMDNLARSSSYRNQAFFESRTQPQSYRAFKDMAQISFATQDSGKTSVDANGNVIAGGGLTTMLGKDIIARQANMKPEQNLLDAQKSRAEGGYLRAAAGGIMGLGKVVGGLGLALGGAGAAVAGTVASAGVAAPLAAALGTATTVGGYGIAASGAKDVFSSFRAAVDVWHGNIMLDKKLKEGEMQAKQSENAVGANKSLDEVLAIQNYQMQAFAGSARGQMAAGQSALNAGAYQQAIGMSGLDEGAAVGLMSGINRNFGSAGKGALSSAYRATAFHGMTGGTAANIAGTFKTLTGDSQALERIMAAGVRQGMGSLDMGFFENLGAASAKAGYSGAEGAMDPGAAAGALFSGRRNPNAFAVQEKIQGLGLASSMFQDNTYLKSRGMASAMGILGPNAKGLDVGALNDASFTALAGGKGSEMLNALGITSNQRRAMLKSRVNTLIDPLRPNLPGLKEGQSSSDYLQGLIGNLGSKNKGTRTGAEHDLARLAAVGAGTYGEEFGGMRGMFEAMGASPAQMKQFEKNGVIGKLPGGVTPGAAGRELSGAAKLRGKDIKTGEQLSQDIGTAERAILHDENGQITNQMNAQQKADWYGWARPTDKTPVTDAEKAKRKAGAAQDIAQIYGHTTAGQAEAAGPSYQATQDLITALKGLTDVIKQPKTLKDFFGMGHRATPAERATLETK